MDRKSAESAVWIALITAAVATGFATKSVLWAIVVFIAFLFIGQCASDIEKAINKVNTNIEKSRKS